MPMLHLTRKAAQNHLEGGNAATGADGIAA